MQRILAIDIALEPAVAALIETEGQNQHVVQLVTSPRSQLWPESGTDEAPAAPSLTPLLAQLHQDWSNAVVLTTAHDSAILPLELPFGDPRSIARVIRLEVQDLVPFDSSEFLIQPQLIEQRPNGQWEVLASLLSRETMAHLSLAARNAELEPLVVTTPATSLMGLWQLAGEQLAGEVIVFCENPQQIHAGFGVGGKPRLVHSFNKSDAATALASEFKRIVLELQTKYACTFENTYYFGPTALREPRLLNLSNTPQPLSIPECSAATDNRSAQLLLAALYVRDQQPLQPWANFKSEEFAYRPPLKELRRGLKQLAPWAGAAVALIVLGVVGLYSLREWQIGYRRNGIVKLVQTVVPDFTAAPGAELDSFKREIDALGQSLGSLGFASRLTPWEALSLLSEDLRRETKDFKFRELEILTNRIRFKGTATEYRLGPRLTRVLQQRRDVYCDISIQPSGPAGRVNIDADIKLCD